MRFFVFFIGWVFCFGLFPEHTAAQPKSKNDAVVVASVGKQKVTYGELKKNYKNSASASPSLTELENFLPLYMEYLAKVQSAEEQGYFNDPDLIAEYEQYAKQAAYSYWLEHEIKPAEFEKFYEKAGFEVKAEHVLTALPGNASPEDTLEAYTKLLEARQKFLRGEADMKQLNEEYSSSSQGRLMGGELPWMGAGAAVTEFEDAVYGLKPGEISMPVRSQFGYHLIHLSKKRKVAPGRKTAHIFVRSQPEKIERAYQALRDGMPWAEAVNKYSEDGPSAGAQGNIGWIKYGVNFSPDFVAAVMQTDAAAGYNPPVKTTYGYHILKIDSVEVYADENAKREALMQEFLNSSAYRKSNTFILEWIRNHTNYFEDRTVYEKYRRHVLSSEASVIDEIPKPDFGTEVLAAFRGINTTVNDFDAHIRKQHGGAPAGEFRKTWFTSFADQLLDSQMVDLVSETYPEFKDELNTYKTGLAVFNINNDKVWSAATADTSALLNIFAKNRDSFHLDQRSFYYLLSAPDTSLRRAVDFIQRGNSPDSVSIHYPHVSVIRDSSAAEDLTFSQRMAGLEKHSFTEEFDYNNGKAVIYFVETLPERPMSFEEAFPRLLSEYQPVREENWLKKLRKKYKMKSDLKKLKSAFQNDSGLHP